MIAVTWKDSCFSAFNTWRFWRGWSRTRARGIGSQCWSLCQISVHTTIS